ncbi:MAG: DUF3105 domain-containing protein [Anaerolineales bacterium]|jgi:hypothetical protein
MAKSKRQRIRERRARQRRSYRLWWIVGGAVVLVLVGIVAWTALRPVQGEAAPIMADVSHVADGEDPGPYNTDPPTSGRHYANSLGAGFYDETQASQMGEHPEGFLVHNLEHGYVIFWYNCAALDNSEDCTQLKDQLRATLDSFNNVKVIAFPWESIDVPVVATSWGRMLRFERFNPSQAESFVKTNRYKAPEPDAP